LIQLRWTDPRPDDPASPGDWRAPALILATLFFNFFFWFELVHDFPFSGPPALYLGTLIGAAFLTIALFYLGPAFAGRAADRSLFDLVAVSIGSFAAWAFRLCCALFAIGWITGFTTVFFAFSWRYRQPSSLDSLLVACPLVLFLFVTGLQSLRTNGKLAFFTNKLAIAMLIAGLIRVRSELPDVWNDFAQHRIGHPEAVSHIWLGLGVMLGYAAPWALLAANFSAKRTKRQVVLIGSLGIALPLIVATGIVAFASQASHGPFRNIASALWNHDSIRYLPAVMMFAAITLFGAVRFGARTFADAFSFVRNRVLRGIVLGVGAIGSATLAVLLRTNVGSFDLLLWLGYLTRALGIVAAILTADAILRWRPLKPRRIDWIGALAFLAGWAAPCYLPDSTPGASIDQHWQPWLLASYAMAFAVCASGRAIQKIRARNSAPA